MSVKDPLRRILRAYFNVEVDDLESLSNNIKTASISPDNSELIKIQLREAIDNKLISTDEYEKLTDYDFDSQEELQEWL